VNHPELVAAAERSELFTGPTLESDMARFLDEQADRLVGLARSHRASGLERVFFIGAGGSWASMYSGAYVLRRYTRIRAEAMLPYQLIWEAPPAFDAQSVAIFASYSGETEDTIAALRFARSRGVRTVAIVRDEQSTIGREADETIAYHARDLYGLPLAGVYLYAFELAREGGLLDVDAVQREMFDLPPLLGQVFRNEREPGEALARELLPEQVLYAIAAGPLYGLAYKFALTVFMENIRVHGSVIESSEFRHGPAEMLERQHATIFALLADDESRAMTERSIAIASDQGARVVSVDAARFGSIHPLLSPFVLLIPLQWFVVHSALLRGILDLDERVLMGKGVLSTGGARWP
jgi:fructoselysine 6-phosphate deglycase